MIRRRSVQIAALALVLAVLLWCAGPAHGQPVVGDVPIISTTVASLPASSTIPRLVVDGSSSSDCTTGGGSTFVWCYWNGSAWAAFGDGGGAGGSGDVTDVGDCATGACFQAVTARHAFLGPTGGGVAAFRAITEADVSDLQTYLLNIVEDTTPQLGGTLDAQGNGITVLGDVTFQTGASGGTLRTGTSAADLFKLQAYDVDGGAYLDMLELDAGNTPVMSLLHVTEIDLDAGGVIRTGTAAGDTALIQARDVDGAAWTTFATLTANDTPTFDLAASTTVGGATIQTGVDDTGTDDQTAAEVPITDTGGFFTGTDVEAALQEVGPTMTDARAPTDDSVDADALADGDLGDVSVSGGVVSVDSGAVGITELGDDATCAANEVVARNAGDTAFECQAAGGGGTPGGSDTHVQYNDGGAFGGEADLAWNDTSKTLTLGGTTATAQLKLPLSNDATTPTLAFGDGDTGFYEEGDDTLDLAVGGAVRWLFSATVLGGRDSSKPGFAFVNPSSTVPSIRPALNDPDTGVGMAAANEPCLIAGGACSLKATATGATITDVLTITPRASAPASCAIGDVYSDTSGELCVCTSTNTWTGATGVGSCA